ncbi:MAG: hypothetical protein P4L60_19840, partial [Clostridium sp.]|nr:hypothetical protein [Clostridium sp.]
MSNLRLKKINDESVNEVPHMGKKDSRPIKGSRLFDEIYANILLVARKKSGKTSCIFKIIQECCTKDTTIVAFVSTLHKDASWQSIQEYCDTKDIPFIGHTSITDEEGHNQLADLVKHLPAKMEVPEEDPEDKQRVVLFNEKDETKPKKERKSKFRSP